MNCVAAWATTTSEHVEEHTDAMRLLGQDAKRSQGHTAAAEAGAELG